MGDLVGVELAIFHGHGDLFVPRIGEAGQEQQGPQHIFVAGAFRSARAIDPEPNVALRLKRGPQEGRASRRRHQAGERGLSVSGLLEIERVEDFNRHTVVCVVEGEENLERLLPGRALVDLGGDGRGHDHVERSLAGVAVAGEEGVKIFNRLWHLLLPVIRAPVVDGADCGGAPYRIWLGRGKPLFPIRARQSGGRKQPHFTQGRSIGTRVTPRSTAGAAASARRCRRRSVSRRLIGPSSWHHYSRSRLTQKCRSSAAQFMYRS